MRTLKELKDYLTVIPKPFASDAAVGGVSDFVNAASDETNFDHGFPQDYSRDPNTQDGKWILRSDMNALGQMASKEAFFKEAGGVHTYDEDIPKASVGYPEGAVLTSFDGEYLALVESQERANHKSFIDEDERTDYSVVNGEVKYDGERKNPRVLWKTVNWIGGLEDGAFRLYLNYSDAHQINENTQIKQDSLVIGTYVYFVSLPKPELSGGMLPVTYDIDATSFPLYHETNITAPNSQSEHMIATTNKGRFGDALGAGVYITGNFHFHAIPVVSYTGGTGNYYFSFFAKAGSSISTIVRINGEVISSKKPYWYAIPIEAKVEGGDL